MRLSRCTTLEQGEKQLRAGTRWRDGLTELVAHSVSSPHLVAFQLCNITVDFHESGTFGT